MQHGASNEGWFVIKPNELMNLGAEYLYYEGEVNGRGIKIRVAQAESKKISNDYYNGKYIYSDNISQINDIEMTFSEAGEISLSLIDKTKDVSKRIEFIGSICHPAPGVVRIDISGKKIQRTICSSHSDQAPFSIHEIDYLDPSLFGVE